MLLEVLIVTPSGPFGELIRFTLEADPEFHCTMLDNSGELRATLQEKPHQAVIYDGSFPQPVPAQVVAEIHDEFPSTAILLIPANNRSEPTIPADGWVTRPFDASSLAQAVKMAVEKRANPGSVKVLPPQPEHKASSWWNAFQSGIRETAADSGLMVQNGLVIASTPTISTGLQQQVTASVLRFWNPDESSDLMRYVKDLVNGQEWMMYATKAAEGAVLVLLYLPQTPVTRVRAQTLKLAREVAGLMGKPDRKTGYLESSEPPRLQEILDGKTESGTPHVIKNGFPVEWFRESDLPDFQEKGEESPETPSPEASVQEVAAEPASVLEEPPAEPADMVAIETSIPQGQPSEFSSSDLPVDEEEPSEEPVEPVKKMPDLGKFQAVELTPEIKDDSGLDDMQPISLEAVQPAATPLVPEESKPAGPAEPEPTPAELEFSLSLDGISGEGNPPPAGFSPIPPVGITSPNRDEVEEALSVLSSRLAKENVNEEAAPELENDSLTIDTQKILSDTDSYSIDVESFQAELSKLEFNDTWAMPEILTGSPQEPAPMAPSESEEMATFLAGMEAQTPQLSADESPAEEPVAVETTPEFNQVGTPMAAMTGKEIEPPAGVEGTGPSITTQEPEDTAQSGYETYTTAIIPRNEAMYLQRPYSAVLNQTMSRLALAFNWKLENVTIRPTYMQWTVTLPLSQTPEEMIAIVRKETTDELIKSNPDELSGIGNDYWFPQTMSAAGKDFVPSIHWQDFILRRKTQEIA